MASEAVPTFSDYRTVDYRAVVRCTVCGAHLEYRDKAKHSEWHRFVKDLWERLTRLENPQDKLFDEPPF